MREQPIRVDSSSKAFTTTTTSTTTTRKRLDATTTISSSSMKSSLDVDHNHHHHEISHSNSSIDHDDDEEEEEEEENSELVSLNSTVRKQQQQRKTTINMWNWITNRITSRINSMRLFVLVILSLQNSMFTVLRRYSQGVLKEDYSKYELLLVGEVIKIIVSAYMIQQGMRMNATITADGSALEGQHVMIGSRQKVIERIQYVTWKSGKMVGLAFIYGAMNILSFVSLRNIGAGMFTIFAQCKIFTTALFSTLLLHRQYSWTKWRALIALMLGVLLFSEPIWGKSENLLSKNDNANVFLGTAAVLIEVTLSGFASIYFEKVIKTDPLQLNIWERNFQLALGSFPVYIAFIAWEGGGTAGLFGGWSFLAVIVALLGAAGGLLVALSIKYGDAILKTLATTAAIILSSVLDWWFLGGPLTPTMVIAGVQVIIAICNYTFDTSPTEIQALMSPPSSATTTITSDGLLSAHGHNKEMSKDSNRPLKKPMVDEEVALVQRTMSSSSSNNG